MLNIYRKLKKLVRTCFHTWRFKRKALFCGKDLKVNFKSLANNKTTVGDNFNSNGLLVIGNGELNVGKNFHCGFGCNIITENHKFKDADQLPYGSEYERKTVNIGDNVWLGINVTILPGVTIGEGVIVQAGSVVVSDIEPLSICGGHPAIVFSCRDKVHYDKINTSL